MTDTVYDDTWISLGVGVGYGPSYDGSDDYVAFPAPIVQGRVAGIGIQPRPAGLGVDEGAAEQDVLAYRGVAVVARRVEKFDRALERLGQLVGEMAPRLDHARLEAAQAEGASKGRRRKAKA